MKITPEILHLLDAKLVTDPDERHCAGCSNQFADDVPVYDVSDFPAGTWDIDARASFCVDCLSDYDGPYRDENHALDALRAEHALREKARRGEPYSFDELVDHD